MLKLERVYKSRDINIRLRKRDRFLNRIFWQAFFIALGIHLFGLIFFKIQTLLTHSATRLSPIIAHADLDLTKDNFHVQVMPDQVPRNYPLAPPRSSPRMPKMALPPLIRQTEYVQENTMLNKDPFRELQKEFMAMPSSELPLKTYPSLDISLLGALSSRSWNYRNPIKMAEGLIPSFDEPLLAMFSIQLDENSGEIFWKELVQSTGVEKLDQFAEKILENVKISHDDALFASNGLIEIRFINRIE